MIPILQKRAKDKFGDCLPACIASILEVPLEEVPLPAKIEYFNTETWQLYLYRLSKDYLDKKGFYLVGIGHNPEVNYIPKGYSILTLTNPGRRHRAHSVVTHDGKIVWDPSPYKQTLTLKLYWLVLVPKGQSFNREQSNAKVRILRKRSYNRRTL